MNCSQMKNKYQSVSILLLLEPQAATLHIVIMLHEKCYDGSLCNQHVYLAHSLHI